MRAETEVSSKKRLLLLEPVHVWRLNRSLQCNAGCSSTSPTICSFRGSWCVCALSLPVFFFFFNFVLFYLWQQPCHVYSAMLWNRQTTVWFPVGIPQCSWLALLLCGHVQCALQILVIRQVPLFCFLVKHSDSNKTLFLSLWRLPPIIYDQYYPLVLSLWIPYSSFSLSLHAGVDQQCPRRFLLLPGEPHQSQLQAGGLQHWACW